MPVRRQAPVVVIPRSHSYASSSRHDYGIDDSITRAGYLSNAVLEDTYRAANKSRGRDHDLLRSANAAIISTEQHASPRVAVVSRRVRASSVPPASRPALQRKVATTARRANSPNNITLKPVVLDRETPWLVRARSVSIPHNDSRRNSRAVSIPRNDFRRPSRAVSVPPNAIYYDNVEQKPLVLASEGLWAHRPKALRKDAVRLARARAHSLEPQAIRKRVVKVNEEPSYQTEFASQRLRAHRPPFAPRNVSRGAKEVLEKLRARASSEPRFTNDHVDRYYTDPANRALVRYLYADRGRFGADFRPRRFSLGEFPKVYVPWSGQGPSNRSKEGVFYRSPSSEALYASRPPLPKPTDRKAIRDLDGFTKPKNLLSWQYRVESRLNPDDLIYQPSRFGRMREQVRGVREKMDRERQLLDRYLDSDFKIKSSSSSYNGTSTGGSSAGGDPMNRPVSELRRKLRRKIAQSKNNPDYYRE